MRHVRAADGVLQPTEFKWTQQPEVSGPSFVSAFWLMQPSDWRSGGMPSDHFGRFRFRFRSA